MTQPYRSLPQDLALPALEETVLARWRERNIFHESLRRREGRQPWVFYEGPPTANGSPGSHHVLSRSFKDIFLRYKTMQGFYVARKAGWDCHGLPVEIAVEQKLGFDSKEDIETYGIAQFNAQCRESVFALLEEWDALTERIGFWLDLDQAYRTLDSTYIESVWWALKQIFDRGLLYEGHKVVPYCTRCGTALSSHEVAQGYKDVEDPSVYIRLTVNSPVGKLQTGDILLVWTTTPWTLVTNAAVAVAPELEYVRARADKDSEIYVVAESLLERVLSEDVEVLDRFLGADIAGAGYQPPFNFFEPSDYGDRGNTVVEADYVSADDGTGLVHISVAFGEDDFAVGAKYGLTVINPVRRDGTYDERVGPYAGMWVKAADTQLIEDLAARGLIHHAESYTHSYPHCWRCGTPLIYYAKPSWYIGTSQIRDRLLASNETVTWYPPHIKHGRFGHWLENNVDWAISRERYWGTPLPIWRCENGHSECIGSFAQLEKHVGTVPEDPHRPYVDDLKWDCAECGAQMQRVPEVIDGWFDSGSMPFAQWHAPFEHEQNFEAAFPADFICEAIDQTRGWFYSLLAVSTLLFDRAPYHNVLCLGHIADSQGRKMSKSVGNVVDPWDVINAHGADAFRWYYLTSKQPWDGYLFSTESVGESVRQFLLQLWNVYGFFVLYANVNDVSPEAIGDFDEAGELNDDISTNTVSNSTASELGDLDRWVLSLLSTTVESVTESLDNFDATSAGRAIADYVDQLSNWYVRRSRRRFWDGDPQAFAVLRHCLVTVSKLLAPFCPFIADEIYDNLDGREQSVHLCDFPTPGPRDHELEEAMAVVRETVRLGLAARAQAKMKVRQPLHAAVVVAQGAELTAIERLHDIVLEELNVKELRFVSEADELGSYEAKPNYRRLGPRFGPHMPKVAAAVAALDPADIAATLRAEETVGINVDGREHRLEADDLILVMSAREGYELEREGSHAVALELELDDDLRREGWARDIVHAVQNLRKKTGLNVEDRINLKFSGDDELLTAVRAHSDYIAGETLALAVEFDLDDLETARGDEQLENIVLDGLRLGVWLAKAA